MKDDSFKTRYLWALLLASLYGVFTNVSYAIAIALYFVVFGDNSSTYGLYGIAPAAIVALFCAAWLYRSSVRGKPYRLILVVLVTAPIAILFTYKLSRYGF